MTSEKIVNYFDAKYDDPNTSILLKGYIREYRGYGWRTQSKRLMMLKRLWSDLKYAGGPEFLKELLKLDANTYIKLAKNNIYTLRHKLKNYNEDIDHNIVIFNRYWIDYWNSIIDFIKYVLNHQI